MDLPSPFEFSYRPPLGPMPASRALPPEDPPLGVVAVFSPGRSVLALRGELDLYSSQWLEPLLEAATAGRPLRVVVDATDLTFVDLTGLRCLEQAAARLAEHGGYLVLRSPRPMLLRLLELAGAGTTILVDRGDGPRLPDLGSWEVTPASLLRAEAPVPGEPVLGEPVPGEPVLGEPVPGEPARGEDGAVQRHGGVQRHGEERDGEERNRAPAAGQQPHPSRRSGRAMLDVATAVLDSVTRRSRRSRSRPGARPARPSPGGR